MTIPAEVKTVLVSDLTSPFGMALVEDRLYIANTYAVVSVPYSAGTTEIGAAPVKLADLPAGSINHHWTKGLIASPDGKHLYAAVGSNSDHGENGMSNESNRAAILEIDIATGTTCLFASGLRNPVGTDWEPRTACYGPPSTNATNSVAISFPTI